MVYYPNKCDNIPVEFPHTIKTNEEKIDFLIKRINQIQKSNNDSFKLINEIFQDILPKFKELVKRYY